MYSGITGLRDFAPVVELALEAGDAISRIYRDGFNVSVKEDRTPLTEADLASHGIIEKGLQRLTPKISVLSEEGGALDPGSRLALPSLWIVDPLDGTKEFIKRNGEFTVNIALVEGGRVVWGVVHAPALGIIYHGGAGLGAWRSEGGGDFQPISVALPMPGRGLVVVKSRSHPSEELDEYCRSLSIEREIEVGSSLKFCAVADGRAHLYPRFGPTMEWDTAAGQAVLEGAGGRVVTLEGEPLRYNKPDLKNPWFVASGGGELTTPV